MGTFLYDDKFCATRGKHREWQKTVGRMLCKQLKITSVIDFGCSIGSFLEGFLLEGAYVQGYDIGFKYSEKYTPIHLVPFIKHGDVTKPISCLGGDCSFSIEVAEHIDPKGSEAFINNLCLHSSKYIILSAAPLGQGGVGHINCRPSREWIGEIEKRGFPYNERITADILNKLKNIKGVPSWIKSNLMVFEK